MSYATVQDSTLRFHQEIRPISDFEFENLAELIHDAFGITTDSSKKTLVTSRLQGLLHELNLQSYKDLWLRAKSDSSGFILSEISNRITTNVTYFYREPDQFDLFQAEILPNIITRLEAQNDRDLRIWTAGCSTGEESFLLQILVCEALGIRMPDWQAGILATDISLRVLEKAKKAMYTTQQLEHLAPLIRQRYFDIRTDGLRQIKKELRDLIVFRRHNLSRGLFQFSRPFHTIFCRNVLIYFDRTLQERIIREFHRALAPGGYLFVGSSEGFVYQDFGFDFIAPAVYQKR